MKNSLKTLAALFAVFVGSQALAADPELAGVWQGKLQVDPKTALTIQFNFTKKPDGTYSAVLNSPDNDAMKNVSADSVSWSGGALKLDVKSLGGAYSGAAKGGSIEGKWSQPGSTIPMVLSPYQKPQLSKAAIDTLTGTWSGKIKIPSGEITMINRFKLSDKGELQGTIAALETGGQETPLSDIEFADNKLTYRIPRVNGSYSASFSNGVFTGLYKQAGLPPEGATISLKKGDVAAAYHPLKLSAEGFATLSGSWKGTLEVTTPQGQKVSLPLVLRFGTDDQARMVGFIDSPQQKVNGIPLIEATLEGGKFDAKTAIGMQLKGDISGKTLTGRWLQGPLDTPLTLTKQ